MMFGRVRPGRAWVLAGLALACFAGRLHAQDAGEDAAQAPAGAPTAVERELKFLQGLRERGYYDLAMGYIEEQLGREGLPDGLKAALTFEQGRGLLEEATNSADLDRRQALSDLCK